MMDALTAQDKQFLDMVRQHKPVGYGRMMSIISHQWFRELEAKYGEGYGGIAFDTVTVGSLSDEERKEYMSYYRSDPLFKD